MIKAISTHLFMFEPLSDSIIDLLADNGFARIEIWGMAPHFPYRDRSALGAIRRKLADAGVEVLSVHAPLWASHEEAMAGERLCLHDRSKAARSRAVSETVAVMEAAAAFSARFAVLHPDMGEGDSKKLFLESLDILAEEAERLEMRLALENVLTPFSRPAGLMEMVAGYDPGRVGICIDIGHANIDDDPAEAVDCCSTRLISLHVTDNDGTWDAHQVPFLGTVPWERVINALRGGGYEGSLVYEVGDTDRDPSLGIERVKPLLAGLKDAHDRLVRAG